MNEELNSLLRQKTWVLIDPPEGRKIIKNKWVFKCKADGRLKSRLVARGFTQIQGIDYDETWSPVGRKSSLKLFLIYALQNSWSMKQMDVDTAFLNLDLKEELFMEQPIGFHDGTKRVCKLLKSVYGLKQSSREWYNTLKKFLESQNLRRSRIDPCIYFSPGLAVFVYVDDIIIAANSSEQVERLSDQFKKRFKMKDMGQPSRILGLDIVETRSGTHLSCRGMIEDLLKKFGLENSRFVSTTMDHNQSFFPNEFGKANTEDQQTFMSIIGSLLYISNTLRPDISYAVSTLSQFTNNPSEDHLRAVKRILRYLNGTKEFGILLKPGQSSDLKLCGYTDADFASCFSRKSRSGFMFFIGESLVSWSSKKQNVVALSTCEAEYYALTEGGKEAIHLNRLVWEFNNQQPILDDTDLKSVTLYFDSQ